MCWPAERLTVVVRVLNPLQVDLEVKNIRLRARHSHAETGATVTEGLIDPNPLPTSLSSSAASPYPAAAPFVIATQDVLLPAGESVMMALSLLPLTQGSLVIEGVQWDVLALHGFHPFNLPLRSLPLAPGKRGQPVLQPDPSLSVPITAPAPLLSISLTNLPSQCFHGEYVQASLQLTNAGAIGLTKLSVRVSHPGYVLLGLGSAPSTSSAPSPSPLAVSASTPTLSSRRASIPSPLSSSSYSVYPYDWNDAGRIHLPMSLPPLQSVTIPVYIRGPHEGQHLLSFLFRYESMDAATSTTGRFRLGYIEREMKVRPLMGVRLFNKPSFAEVKDSLLGLDIHDRQGEGTETGDDEVEVKVERVGVLSKCWVIAAVGERPDTSLATLPATRSVSTQDLHASHVKGGVGKGKAGEAVNSSSHTCVADSVMSPHSSLLLFTRITNLPSLSLSSPLLQAQCPTQFSSVTFLSPSQTPDGPPPPSSSSPSPSAPDCTRPPYSNLLGMEKAILIDEERQSLIINPAAVIADVGAPNKLDLLLSWTLNTSPPRFGFHHMPGVSIMKVMPSACPLKVHLSYPPIIHPPSSPSPSPSPPASSPSSSPSPPNPSFPLQFPVHVHIRNILEDSPISFQFETLPPEEEFDPVRRQFRTLTSTSMRGRYAWHGLTRVKVPQLKGGEEAEVVLYVDVDGEGEYNLNRFRFTVEVGGGKKPRVFFFPLQHLVRVEREGGGGGGGGIGGSGAVSVNHLAAEDGDKRYERMEEVAH